jgi:transcriptional regulator GlxA family with amidase domain
VTTVCTGTALLARTGLLDGHRATTNNRAFSRVTNQGPAVSWIADAHWVADGKYVPSGGISAGINMSLAVTARALARATARQTASYAENTWQDEPTLDPFASFARPPTPPPE